MKFLKENTNLLMPVSNWFFLLKVVFVLTENFNKIFKQKTGVNLNHFCSIYCLKNISSFVNYENYWGIVKV